MRKLLERLTFGQMAALAAAVTILFVAGGELVKWWTWANKVPAPSTQQTKAQDYLTCWEDPTKAVQGGTLFLFDCNEDGLVDGVRNDLLKVIVVATQDLANQLRRAELEEALKNDVFKSICGDGRLDNGTIITDDDGYPYVSVCGGPAPVPGHPLWIRWLGRDTPDGQVLQKVFQGLKAKKAASPTDNPRALTAMGAFFNLLSKKLFYKNRNQDTGYN